MNDIKKQLGQRIKEIRKSKNLTQEKLAENIGIESNNLSRLESGKNYPSAETVSKLAKALGVAVYELFIFSSIKSHEEMLEEIYGKLKNDKSLTLKVYSYIKK